MLLCRSVILVRIRGGAFRQFRSMNPTINSKLDRKSQFFRLSGPVIEKSWREQALFQLRKNAIFFVSDRKRASSILVSDCIRSGLRACPKRIENRNPESKVVRFREYFRRGVQTESKRENRNPGEKQRRAQLTGQEPSMTVHTCRQYSAQQHRSTTEAGKRDDTSTPGGC